MTRSLSVPLSSLAHIAVDPSDSSAHRARATSPQQSHSSIHLHPLPYRFDHNHHPILRRHPREMPLNDPNIGIPARQTFNLVPETLPLGDEGTVFPRNRAVVFFVGETYEFELLRGRERGESTGLEGLA